MSAAEKLTLEGDWLTEEEAALYCRVSLTQFKKYVHDYAIMPRRFMGKKVYEKAALYAAIYESELWQRSRSTGAMAPPISIGARAPNGSAAASERSISERLRRYEERRRQS